MIGSTLSNAQATGNIIAQTDDNKVGSTAGGLVGWSSASTVSNSSAAGNVTGADDIGGLIGYAVLTDVDTSASLAVSITGANNVGGIFGRAEDSTAITTISHVTGVEAGSSYAGGFVGLATCGSQFESSAAHTDVISFGDTGGFAGADQGCDSDSPGAFYTNVEASGYVEGHFTAGGLIGTSNRSIITASRATSGVDGAVTSGGLVGSANGVDRDQEVAPMLIQSSYATGDVYNFSGAIAGGLVGEVDGAVVTDSYARGDVYDDLIAGGVVGLVNENAAVRKTYATGTVTVSEEPVASGGVAGLVYDGGEATDSYWDVDTSGIAASDFGTGKTTTEMKTQSTFVGWAFASVWEMSPAVNDGYPCLHWSSEDCRAAGLEADTDGDGTPDSIENAGPNDGDANNDGIADAEQANVTSFSNLISGKYSVLQTTCDNNFNVQNGAESDDPKDAAYNYPVGLLSFKLEDCGLGGTATVTATFTGNFDPEKVAVRKVNTQTGAFTTLTSANSGLQLTRTTLYGKPALRVVYQITDGGPFDQDGTVNGTIVDPIGVARLTTSVPNTGLAASN